MSNAPRGLDEREVQLRRDALTIFAAALEAVDPERLVREALEANEPPVHADGKLTVIHVVAGSAAEAAGLAKGDVVRAIGPISVTEQNWADTPREQLRQPPGTSVTVTTSDGREISLVLADYF